MADRKRFNVTLLLITLTYILVKFGIFLIHLLDRRFGPFFKVRFFTIKMIESTRHFTSQLDMRNLIFPDRNKAGFINQDIGTLQQWITEKSIGCEVFIIQLFLLILKTWHTFQPPQRRDHAK